MWHPKLFRLKREEDVIAGTLFKRFVSVKVLLFGRLREPAVEVATDVRRVPFLKSTSGGQSWTLRMAHFALSLTGAT